jgi:hydroxymethylpyrimidine/phosphomethylpyrimidine kinase
MLIISGLDGTASAGIILDSFIAKLFNINHFCVLPALTMQNHNSYYGTQELNLQKQLDCINIEPSVVKIGLLYSAKNIEIVAKYLKQFPNAKIICDTPIVSSSGKNLVHNIAEY